MSKILVIDDDCQLAESIKSALSREGFIVDIADCGSEAESMLKGFDYDLIILDWRLPDTEGIDLLKKLRGLGLQLPVLMLTGMKDTENKIAGLETGADDYLTKPFNRAELASRIRALLRRPRALAEALLNVSGVSLDLRTLKVTWHGTELKLTKQEYQLLELLMRHKDQVFSQDQLVDRAWPTLSDSSRDTVRVHMSRLRKKFENGPAPCPLRTVHGQGYVFVSSES